jgi:hypothetical protein
MAVDGNPMRQGILCGIFGPYCCQGISQGYPAWVWYGALSAAGRFYFEWGCLLFGFCVSFAALFGFFRTAHLVLLVESLDDDERARLGQSAPAVLRIGFDRVVRSAVRCGVCSAPYVRRHCEPHGAVLLSCAGFSRRDDRGFVAKYGSIAPQTTIMHPIDAMHRHATAATLDATVSVFQTALDSVEAARHDASSKASRAHCT